MDELIRHPIFDSLNLFIRYERMPSLKELGYVCYWSGTSGGVLVLNKKAMKPENISRLSTSVLDKWENHVGVDNFALPVNGMSDKQYYVRLRYGFRDYSTNATYESEGARPQALTPVAPALQSARILFILEAHRLSHRQFDLLYSFCHARVLTSRCRLIPILIVRRSELPHTVKRIKGYSNSTIRKMFFYTFSHVDLTYADVDYF